jgi:Ribosomal protein L11 methyltransferase (PrmA)
MHPTFGQERPRHRAKGGAGWSKVPDVNVHAIPKLLEYHGDMLADAERVNAFARALREVVTPGAIVLDLGGGTGILSALACRAGAGRVYMVEEGPILGFAREVLRANGVADRVTCISGLSTESQLPEPVDVIVTETIGVAGLDEGILGFVVDARRRFGRPGASPVVVPGRITLWAAPVSAEDVHERLVARWRRGLAGLDFGTVATRAANHLYIRRVDAESLVAPGAQLCRVDLLSLDQAFVEGTARFSITRPATVHGFVVWFEAELTDAVRLSNAPTSGAGQAELGVGTHWSHGFLPVPVGLAVERGDELELAVQINDGGLWRWRGSANGQSRFDQCTAFGAPLDPGALPG